MRGITEALTQKEYDISLSEEDYNVVFGYTYTESNIVISAEGNRNYTHLWLELESDMYLEIQKMGVAPKKTWRYVPFTETIYWWNRYSGIEDQVTNNHLKAKYGYIVKHKVSVDDEIDYSKMTPKQRNRLNTMLTTGHSILPSGEIPSFKDWYNTHVGD